MENIDRRPVKLTPFAKALGLAVIVTVTFVGVRRLHALDTLAPKARTPQSVAVPKVEVPTLEDPANSTPTLASALPGAKPGCANLPEVRMELWAWNAQMGAMLANGGVQSTEGSLMCKHGVNLRLIRQDDSSKMREDLVNFAVGLTEGNPNPSEGVHFVAIMGDGSAAFLKELNDVLDRQGSEYRAKVIGSMGYSWGEDKFMGPPSWKENPAASRGGLVAGVLRDGDWNIAQKWLGENQLCNNPDEKTFDPDCLNWVNTPGYVEAAQAYVAGYCETRPVVKHGQPTGETKKVCVQGVVTWTPGDVTVAQKKGGLVSIVSTKEYRGQMPNTLIGIDKWMKSNHSIVEGMLAAIFEGGDQVKADRAALHRAAEISAAVYKEESAAYWEKYFRGVVETDRQGLQVELGGSRVNNLADNLYLFGLAPQSTNLFAVTYTVFGNIVRQQYPDLVPGFAPAAEILDTRYVQALAQRSAPTTRADEVTFSAAEPVRKVVSHGSWEIAFQSGKAEFSPKAEQALNALFDQLVLAGGAAVEIHGHTDSSGDAKANYALSEARAFAVKSWLENKAKSSFPEGRVRVFAHGQENPVAPNATPEGRAKNRRVEIVLGTTQG